MALAPGSVGCGTGDVRLFAQGGVSPHRTITEDGIVGIRASLVSALSIVALALAVPGGALRAQVNAPAVPPPQIVTSASGEARLTPDRANVLVGVQTRAATAAAAANTNNTRQAAIIAAIVALGVPREQISTENYNVYPETQYDPQGRNPRVTGYVVSNVVRVEVRRTDQVGPVIDAALSKGANQINSLEFYASNTDAARRQALADAIAKARGDAEAMARAAGGSLGSLLELVSMDTGPRPIYRAEAMAKQGAVAAMAAPIEPGELTVRTMVTARWQFVQSR